MSSLSLDALSAIDDVLSEDERMIRDAVRRFVRERYLPSVASWYDKEIFPRELIGEIAELGVLGASIHGHGCAGLGPVAYGLVLEELEYGDSGLRSFVSVQGSLAMQTIDYFGSEAQKARWLPGMAAGTTIGCFGLTEADSGSDPGSLQTRARKQGSDYVLSGSKMWITNAPIADLAVVWAKVDGGDADSISAFVVERNTPGFETRRVQGKLSLRASETGELIFDDCRIPAEQRLEGRTGLGAPLSVLNQARFGIAWGVIGAAKACFESALTYTLERRQFAAPIAGKQLIQEGLAEVASEIVAAETMALHYGRYKERHQRLHPSMVSLLKRNNVRMALEAARRCRAMLGANGILLEYPVMRHMLNLESVYTYEGTHEIHTLILGKTLTGLDGF